MIKKLFYDLETTGVNYKRNSIHQISGIIDYDGDVIEEFDIRLQPHPKAEIEPEALEISGITELDLELNQPFHDGFSEFLRLIGRHIDQYDRRDKFHLVGYNNRKFDDEFLRAWFRQNEHNWYGSFFYSDSIDVMVLMSQLCLPFRNDLKDFKLQTLKEYFMPDYEGEDNYHNSLFDVRITRDLYLLYLYKTRQTV